MKTLFQKVAAGLITAAILAAVGWIGLRWSRSPAVSISVPGTIRLEAAPFEVPVDGTISSGGGKYLYLVVDDGNGEWIEPGLGLNYDGAFHASAYLGNKDGEGSLKKWYTVYAVVTKAQHAAYAKLDQSTLLVRSNEIRLYRTGS